MKHALKAVLLASALMAAQPAFAHDGKKHYDANGNQVDKHGNLVRYDANGNRIDANGTIVSNKSWAEKKNDQIHADRMDRRTDDMNGNHTFMGFPTQNSSNLNEDRDELRSIHPSH